MRVAIVLAVAACGRLRFDSVGDVGPLADTATAFRCDAKDVDVGASHTCAVDSTGGVWCWGVNALGQSVPGGGPQAIATPTRIALPGPAAQVAAGKQHSCARLDDGTVWCWGDNSSGQLGNGQVTPSTAAEQVQLGTDRAIDLSAGAVHSCIRRALDSAVMCWGENGALQLGVPTVALSSTPVLVAGTAGTKQIALGHRHSCAIDASDHAVCWGQNGFGQLGSTGGNRETPMPVAGLGVVTRVSAGGGFSCAIEAGSVRCWGRNGSLQLGNPDGMNHPDPQPAIVTGADDVRLFSFGGCALRSDQTIACWDDLGTHALGLTNVTKLAGKFGHRCAVANGALTCWGSNDDGELGRGARSSSATPVPIAIPGGAAHLSVGYEHACADVSGTVWCWGLARNGAVGVSSANGEVVLTPTQLTVPLSTVEGLSSEQYLTCGWGGGNAACWGINGFGQLGQGTVSSSEAPHPVTAATGILSVAAGWSFACANTAAGGVCWGNNDRGQLGNPTVSGNALSAVAVQSIAPPISALDSGGASCAVSGGQAWCWGINFAGNVGNNSQTDQGTPVPITIPGGAAQVSASLTHTCAINGAGAVYCWGINSGGELGVGDTMMRLVPTPVTLPSAATKITVGAGGTCAQLVGGDVTCWGGGQDGENGTGDPVDSLTPAPAPDLAGVDVVVRGYTGGCALRGGQVLCWGASGLLGVDTSADAIPAAPHLNCP